jgi:hypothetical protein
VIEIVLPVEAHSFEFLTSSHLQPLKMPPYQLLHELLYFLAKFFFVLNPRIVKSMDFKHLDVGVNLAAIFEHDDRKPASDRSSADLGRNATESQMHFNLDFEVFS